MKNIYKIAFLFILGIVIIQGFFFHKKYQKHIASKNEKIIILGDIGHFNKILHTILDLCRSKLNKNDKIILLGDNFYPNGVTGIDDKLWNDFQFLFKNIDKRQIYSVLGNHDYHLNPNCQIKNNYWNTPDYYYKLNFNEHTDLFFIDTVQLFPEHCAISKNMIENVHKNDIHNLINNQILWLDNELSKSNKVNKIVFGHYPIITNGYYKNHMKPLYNMLFPIFKKHNVKAYISGHEHNIQYIKKKENGYVLNQFIIGSSSENRNNEYKHYSFFNMYNNKDNFFLELTYYNETLFFDFINIKNKTVYSYTI